jgi:hypothetical protein
MVAALIGNRHAVKAMIWIEWSLPLPEACCEHS